jgi:hypothetical protein
LETENIEIEKKVDRQGAKAAKGRKEEGGDGALTLVGVEIETV